MISSGIGALGRSVCVCVCVWWLIDQLRTDFPEEWPTLVQDLLKLISEGSESQVHGALRVLSGEFFQCDEFHAGSLEAYT